MLRAMPSRRPARPAALEPTLSGARGRAKTATHGRTTADRRRGPTRTGSTSLGAGLFVAALAFASSAGCNKVEFNQGSGGSAEPTTPAQKAQAGPVIAVSVGDQHSCALRSGGGVWCWGLNNRGQLGDGGRENRAEAVPVQGVENAKAIAAGRAHTCALISDGTVRCWGAGDKGQLGDASSTRATGRAVKVAGLANVVGIASGDDHSCAWTAQGELSCWGDNETRQLGNERMALAKVPARVEGFSDVVEVAAGRGHTCARRKTGSILCWGANKQGQLGDGSDRGHARPSKVAGIEDAIELRAAGDATCALRPTGSVMCWGAAAGGGGSRARVISAVSGAKSLKLGEAHACAEVGSGLRCWGDNPDGRLGNGTFEAAASATGVQGLGGVKDYALGPRHTCAVDGRGVVKCWGDEYAATGEAQAEVGDLAPVRGVVGAKDIAAGAGFSCAVDRAGEVSCWGANDKGQLGVGDRKDRDGATKVKQLDRSIAVTAGVAHACAASQDGKVFCWGDDSSGQITPSKSGSRTLPARVGGPRGAIALAAGRAHTCAIEKGGSVFCWGDDSLGQLGDGPGRRDGRVVGIRDAVEIRAGDDHTCVRLAGGTLACWGSNKQGQLGNGAGASQLNIPVEQPVTPTKVFGTIGIAVGAEHSCALLGAGTAQCWGRNDHGQLGSGTSSTWTNRVPVKELTGGTAIGAGTHHTCVTSSGRLRCWGDNRASQCAGGGAVTRTPQWGHRVNATEIEGGTDHSCARTDQGSVVCWGDDSRGQLGLGDRGFARVPVAISGF